MHHRWVVLVEREAAAALPAVVPCHARCMQLRPTGRWNPPRTALAARVEAARLGLQPELEVDRSHRVQIQARPVGDLHADNPTHCDTSDESADTLSPL